MEIAGEGVVAGKEPAEIEEKEAVAPQAETPVKGELAEAKPSEEAEPGEKGPAAAELHVEAAEQLIDRQVWGFLSPEERFRLAAKLHYSFYIRKRDGRLELRAQKWAPSRGKPDKPYIGLWNEALKKKSSKSRSRA